jgi:hypothetical protein
VRSPEVSTSKGFLISRATVTPPSDAYTLIC